MNKNIIAIGRSKYLYDSLKYLTTKGYSCVAIFTDEPNEEYSTKEKDFEDLAKELGSLFFYGNLIEAQKLKAIIKEKDVKIAISANWKYTISKEYIDLFEYGILNYHLGNLPDYKGTATVNWTIINGEDHINGNIHKMDVGLDVGDIISRKSIPIGANTYIQDIIRQAEQDVAGLYEEALEKILKNKNFILEKGSEHGLRCYPRIPEDSRIDWNQDVEIIHRLVRASSSPYNGAYTFLNEQKVIMWKANVIRPVNRILAIPGHVIHVDRNSGTIQVVCKKGVLEIVEMEHNGSKMIPAQYIKSIRTRFK